MLVKSKKLVDRNFESCRLLACVVGYDVDLGAVFVKVSLPELEDLRVESRDIFGPPRNALRRQTKAVNSVSCSDGEVFL